MKQHRALILAVVVSALFASNIAASAEAPHTPPVPEMPADARVYSCIEALIDLLPGDYYACRARYYFERNHNTLGVSMLESASYWAKKDAQYVLGLIYFNGDTPGYAANRPLALAWLGLAAERKDATYLRAYEAASAQSTAADVKQAGVLEQNMRLKYGDRVAGKRALQRFNHGIASLENTANGGGSVYLSGYSPYPENARTVLSDMHKRADADFQGLISTVTVGDVEK